MAAVPPARRSLALPVGTAPFSALEGRVPTTWVSAHTVSVGKVGGWLRADSSRKTHPVHSGLVRAQHLLALGGRSVHVGGVFSWSDII